MALSPFPVRSGAGNTPIATLISKEHASALEQAFRVLHIYLADDRMEDTHHDSRLKESANLSGYILIPRGTG